MHFSSKKLTTFFSCRPQNTGRQRRFTLKYKTNKAVGIVMRILSVCPSVRLSVCLSVCPSVCHTRVL